MELAVFTNVTERVAVRVLLDAVAVPRAIARVLLTASKGTPRGDH